MSIYNPWVQQGFWPSIPKPINAITTPVHDSPQMSICFNSDWQPAVLGALKVLVRPESWVGTQDDVRTSVQEAQELLGHPGPGAGCYGECDINWYLHYADCPDSPNGGYILPFYVPTCEPCALTRIYWGVCPLQTFYGVARGCFEGRTEGGDPAGGPVCSMRWIQTGNVVGNTMNIEWHDCLGTLHTSLDTGDGGGLDNIEVKDISMTALDGFAFIFTLGGPYVCTVA